MTYALKSSQLNTFLTNSCQANSHTVIIHVLSCLQSEMLASLGPRDSMGCFCMVGNGEA